MLVVTFSSTAFAILPILVPATIVLYHGTIAACVWTWMIYQRDGQSSVHPTSGNVVTPSKVIWMDLSTVPPTQREASATMRVDKDNFRTALRADRANYPALDKADTGTQNVNGNDVRLKYFKSEIGTHTPPPYNTKKWTFAPSPYYISYICAGLNQPTYYTWYTLQGNDYVATAEDLQQAINAEKGIYSGDIDNLLKNNPNICQFDPPGSNGSNSGTGSFTQPTPPTSEQIAAAGGAGTGPGNPVNPPGTIGPGTGTGAGGGLPDEDGSYPVPGLTNYGDNRDNNINSRLNDFFNEMKTSPLFSFSTRATGSIPTTGSSTMSFSAGSFGTHTYDYATLSPVYLILSKLFMILTVFTSVKIITKANAA